MLTYIPTIQKGLADIWLVRLFYFYLAFFRSNHTISVTEIVLVYVREAYVSGKSLYDNARKLLALFRRNFINLLKLLAKISRG